jgi:hypothetical protein
VDNVLIDVSIYPQDTAPSGATAERGALTATAPVVTQVMNEVVAKI